MEHQANMLDNFLWGYGETGTPQACKQQARSLGRCLMACLSVLSKASLMHPRGSSRVSLRTFREYSRTPHVVWSHLGMRLVSGRIGFWYFRTYHKESWINVEPSTSDYRGMKWPLMVRVYRATNTICGTTNTDAGVGTVMKNRGKSALTENIIIN